MADRAAGKEAGRFQRPREESPFFYYLAGQAALASNSRELRKFKKKLPKHRVTFRCSLAAPPRLSFANMKPTLSLNRKAKIYQTCRARALSILLRGQYWLRSPFGIRKVMASILSLCAAGGLLFAAMRLYPYITQAGCSKMGGALASRASEPCLPHDSLSGLAQSLSELQGSEVAAFALILCFCLAKLLIKIGDMLEAARADPQKGQVESRIERHALASEIQNIGQNKPESNFLPAPRINSHRL